MQNRSKKARDPLIDLLQDRCRQRGWLGQDDGPIPNRVDLSRDNKHTLFIVMVALEKSTEISWKIKKELLSKAFGVNKLDAMIQEVSLIDLLGFQVNTSTDDDGDTIPDSPQSVSLNRMVSRLSLLPREAITVCAPVTIPLLHKNDI